MDIELIKIFVSAFLGAVVAFETRHHVSGISRPTSVRVALAVVFGFGAGLLALMATSLVQGESPWVFAILGALYGWALAAGQSFRAKSEPSNKANQAGTR